MEAAEPKAAPNCDDPNPETAGVLPDKPLVPRPIDGVRTNLGTRNHEFLRLPDSYGYNGKIVKWLNFRTLLCDLKIEIKNALECRLPDSYGI